MLRPIQGHYQGIRWTVDTAYSVEDVPAVFIFL